VQLLLFFFFLEWGKGGIVVSLGHTSRKAY